MNTTESRGLALGRGFIVLIMPAVHTVLIYSNDAVKAGWTGTVLGFLAEQPGAQLFMLQMGLFIGVGRPKNATQVLKRFCVLLLAGYLLNFLRLVLPYYWGGLPVDFLSYNDIPYDYYTEYRLLASGDILQFAALGYSSCQLVQYFLKSICLKTLLLFLILVISPFTWVLQSTGPLSQHVISLFNGLPPKAFFPFFPWVSYPMAGLVVAQIIRRYHKQFMLQFWLVIAVLLITFGLLATMIEPPEWNKNFYRLGPGGSLFHLGAAIGWIVLFIWLAKKIKGNLFFSFLEWLSKRITIIYFLQWIIIMWLIPLFGFNKLGVGMSLVAIAINTTASFSLTIYLLKLTEAWRYRLFKK